MPIDKIVGIDARGFLFGSAVAYALGVGFVPIRKKGRLPFKTESAAYSLDTGDAEMELHVDASSAGEKIVLIDDLLATGGTSAAAAALIRKVGGELLEAQFLIELEFLHGREKLAPTPVLSFLNIVLTEIPAPKIAQRQLHSPPQPSLPRDHFDRDLLEGDLIVNRVQQLENPPFRHLSATQLDSRGFAGQLRMRLCQFAIEQKRNVSVELLLHLEQLQIGTFPRARFVHREEHFIALRIVGEKIDHIGAGHADRIALFHSSASSCLRPETASRKLVLHGRRFADASCLLAVI